MPIRRLSSCVAVILLFAAAVSAQSDSAPPIPIWTGDGSVPQGSGDRKVFLTPDLHSVIILWPNPDGTETKRKFPLHNEIDPNLRVHIESDSGFFRYKYDLENGMQSKDSLRDFSVVIYPDPNAQLSSAEWTKGSVVSNAHERIGIPGAPSGVLADWTSKLDNPPFLQPGAGTRFWITTSAEPGFTTAETEHFPHMEESDGWGNDIPYEIMQELLPVVNDYGWSANHFITLGPRYGPDDPATRIASDYIVGIQELIRTHRLESDSPFVKEVIANLDAIASGSSAQIPITKKPHSEMEAEILSALQLTLHFTYSETQ